MRGHARRVVSEAGFSAAIARKLVEAGARGRRISREARGRGCRPSIARCGPAPCNEDLLDRGGGMFCRPHRRRRRPLPPPSSPPAAWCATAPAGSRRSPPTAARMPRSSCASTQRVSLGVPVFSVRDAADTAPETTGRPAQHATMVLIDTMGMVSQRRPHGGRAGGHAPPARRRRRAGCCCSTPLARGVTTGRRGAHLCRRRLGRLHLHSRQDEAASLSLRRWRRCRGRHELDIRYLTSGQRVPEGPAPAQPCLPPCIARLRQGQHRRPSPLAPAAGDEAGMLLAAGRWP